MLGIRDLPRGGADAGGRRMWFEVLAEDGKAYAFSIACEQVEAFIAGLRTFQLEAEMLAARLDEGGAPKPAFLNAERFLAELGPTGELRLTLGAPAAGEIRAAIPRQRVRSLLSAIVVALGAGEPTDS